MQNVKLINLDHRHYEIGCIREVLLNGGVVEFSINYKNRGHSNCRLREFG
jgi:hypothetical protein